MSNLPGASRSSNCYTLLLVYS